MWEKAFRGDDGSQFSRKRPERPCGLNSKGLSLCFFELNYKQDTRANAQGRIIGNKHRKGLGTSRADVCWNGRRPCEPEFNYMIREKAVRNESLENPSQCEGFGCGHYNLHKSLNPIRHCHIYSLQFWLLTRVPNTNSPLAFPAHLHYHRTNKKKEFSICTKIAFAAIINVFIPG